MFDPNAIRGDFPFLHTLSNKKPLVYLDNAATSIKPIQVMDAELAYYKEYGVNIHRGLYAASAKATRMFQEVREKVAQFIGASDPRSIVFTRGSTESSNLLSYSWSKTNLKQGDRVISSLLEHHSTLVPWQEACKRHGASLDFIPVDSHTGELDLSNLRTLFKGAKLLVISGMTNATGYKVPLDRIIPLAKELGLCVVVDGAQLVAHTSVDVTSLNCDFLYFSAHKMLGPTGVGVLYGKTSELEAMEPFLFGGDMIEQVGNISSTWAPIPEKFEAGTPNIAGVLGFGVALDYLTKIGMDTISKHEALLDAYVSQKLQGMSDIDLYGPRDRSKVGGILSFNLHGVHSHDTSTILDAQGIAVRAGFHCAMPYMGVLGIGGTVRASYYFYNTQDDIDRLFEGIAMARSIFIG